MSYIIKNNQINKLPNNNYENIKRLTQNLGYTELIVNRLDYYGNSVPLGAFCNAISFILYGFCRCKVYSVNDTFLWAVILIFGGIGQITSGLLEYIKGRTFTSTLYLCYGSYCLSYYYIYVLPLKLSKYNIFGINYHEVVYVLFMGHGH